MMTNDRPLKILVVDDTILYRTIITDVLSELSGVTVVGTARNGKVAIHRIAILEPDILILDIEMPEMDGLEVLEWIRDNTPDVGAFIISSFAKKDGEMTVKALNLGAFDFIQKTDFNNNSMEANKKALKETIKPMLEAYAKRREVREILKGKLSLSTPESESKILRDYNDAVRHMGTVSSPHSSIIAIATSTGGPEALMKILPDIPENINVPLLIVQHMPSVFTQFITSGLNKKCAIEVRAAVDGEPVMPNRAIFAPGGKQMKVEKSADGKIFIIRVTDDRPENNCKPSADYLFRSIAHHYGKHATGVIMTGMGTDGMLGLKMMKRNGAIIIAQNEETCTVFGMPKEPIRLGIVDVIAPLERIAEEICRTVKIKR